MERMKPRREVLVERELMYALTEGECGQLFLEVVSGGVAIENLVLPLSAEERLAYQESGKQVLDDLARRVVKHKSAFVDRILVE